MDQDRVERYRVGLFRRNMQIPPLVSNSRTFAYDHSSLLNYFIVTVPAGSNLNLHTAEIMARERGYTFDKVTSCERIGDNPTEEGNARTIGERVRQALTEGFRATKGLEPEGTTCRPIPGL